MENSTRNVRMFSVFLHISSFWSYFYWFHQETFIKACENGRKYKCYAAKNDNTKSKYNHRTEYPARVTKPSDCQRKTTNRTTLLSYWFNKKTGWACCWCELKQFSLIISMVARSTIIKRGKTQQPLEHCCNCFKIED